LLDTAERLIVSSERAVRLQMFLAENSRPKPDSMRAHSNAGGTTLQKNGKGELRSY
jgi:hypothetical protein